MSEAEKIVELEGIIQNYTTYFLIFDVVFFILLTFGITLAIRFIKSKKHLKDSNEFLLYTIHGQEVERSRIARELHDTVAQDLRYIKSLVDKKTEKNISQVSDLLSKSLFQIRLISYNLAPTDIIKNDFKQSIINLCNYMSDTSSMKIRLSIPDETDFSFLTENDILNLYRIVQESIVNTIKHANASESVVLIRNQFVDEEKGLYMFISDDGIGFDVDQKNADKEKHFGLIGMKKRSQLIGCKFMISSQKNSGTQINIFKPVVSNEH